MSSLNVGCGTDIRGGGWTNLDSSEAVEPDVVHDLDETPWPFEDGEFDHVLAKHVFEHLDNPGEAMAEACRCVRKGGIIEVHVPLGIDALTDPTHKHIWTWETPEFFCEDGPRPYYFDLPLRLESRDVDVWVNGPNRLENWFYSTKLSMLLRGFGPGKWLSTYPYLSGVLIARFRRVG